MTGLGGEPLMNIAVTTDLLVIVQLLAELALPVWLVHSHVVSSWGR